MYGLLAYLTILFTAVGGLIGLSPWLILAGGAALTMISACMYRRIYAGVYAQGYVGRNAAFATMAQSLGHGVTACGLGYGLGWALHFAI